MKETNISAEVTTTDEFSIKYAVTNSKENKAIGPAMWYLD